MTTFVVNSAICRHH